VTGAIDCRIGAQRAQNAQAGHYVPATKPVGALTANMVGCAGTPGYNETEHILPMSIGINGDVAGTIDSNYAKGCGSAAYAERDVVGTLSDGAHNGGGLNGQDAYSGRIFAVRSQPADGADGQGDQHNLGRGPDADCVPGGGN
jgi:hypothetical protein